MTDIKASDTKQKIYDAYTELLEKHQAIKAQKFSQQESIFETPRAKVDTSLPKTLDALQEHFLKEIATIKTKLEEKTQILVDLDTHIQQEKKYLEETQKITLQAESLFALQDMYTSKEEELSDMIIQKKNDMEKKQSERTYEFETKKQKELHTREFKTIEQQKSLDQARAAKEALLKQREEIVKIKEETIVQMEQQIKQLQEQLETMETKLYSQIFEKISTEFATKELLLTRDFETKVMIAEIEKKNLESKIIDTNKQMSEFQKLLQSANTQIQQMATTVVEGKRPVVVAAGEKVSV